MAVNSDRLGVEAAAQFIGWAVRTKQMFAELAEPSGRRPPDTPDELTGATMKMRMLSIAAAAAAVAIATVVTQPVLRAQDPSLRWVKAALFPVTEEELYGVSVNNKMYVIGGFGKAGEPAPAMVWEYDPAPDKWTRKKNLPVAVHHQAQTVLNGKIYFFGGCQRPLSGPGANGQSGVVTPAVIVDAARPAVASADAGPAS